MKNKNTERTLISTLLAMVLCCAMFVGTTYAWFAKSVSNMNNTIITGNLDVGLYQVESTGGNVTETPVTEETVFFEDAKWEPGAVYYENFYVKNEGDLSLKYELALKWSACNFIKESSESQSGPSLTDVLQVAVIKGHIGATEDKNTVLAKVEAAKQSVSGSVENSEQLAIVVYWPNSENDSIYNVSSNTMLSEGNKLFAELGLVLAATQASSEDDSFSVGYDDDAIYPIQEGEGNEE